MFVGVMVERIVARALPARDRDAILGDLAEEADYVPVPWRQCWKVYALVRIAARYHVEPYRDAQQRLASVVVLLLGLGLLWVIPEASKSLFVHPELLQKPLVRVAAVVWGASHLTSGIAVGLFVGCSSFLPECGMPTRVHLAAVLGLSALVAAPTAGAGVLAALTLIGSVAVGDVARRPVRA